MRPSAAETRAAKRVRPSFSVDVVGFLDRGDTVADDEVSREQAVTIKTVSSLRSVGPVNYKLKDG